MNSKLTTNLQLSTTELNKNKYKLRKQLQQEQNHRNGDHMKVYQLEGRRRMGVKVQGLKSTIGRYKIDRGMSRIV